MGDVSDSGGVHIKYSAYDMPSGKTYIGWAEGATPETLEEVAVTDTLTHISSTVGVPSNARDIVGRYIKLYRAAADSLPKGTLKGLEYRRIKDNCIARWYLGENILEKID
jgi:hypothetical protein